MKTTRLLLLIISELAAVLPVFAEVNPIAHYNLQGQGGIRDTAAPPTISGQVKGAPELTRQGSPKIMTSSPLPRRQVSDSSIKFENDEHCYNTNRNLANGSNFVVEVWAYATKADDPGWHAVLANGNGGTGFLIAQNDDSWKVLVGGTGDVTLGKVVPETWTHLAIVKEGGTCSGWINGTRVGPLPDLGVGAANFSIGATAPGKEPLRGWISEARVSTFETGKFEPTDFLLDQEKMKEVVAADLAKRAKLVNTLLQTPGVKVVRSFTEQPATTDWLIQPPTQASNIQIRPGDKSQTADILVTNGLISREFHVADGNLGCTSLRRIDKDIEFLRTIKPETRICLDGNWLEVGGLVGAPDQAFLTPSWLPLLRSKPGSFRLVGMEVGGCVKPYEWQPKCNAPEDIAWPAKGQRLTFQFAAPENSPYQGTGVAVSYEIYDGIPVIMKTFQFINKTEREIVVSKFQGEHLAVQPMLSAMLHVESDYSFALANFRETSSGLGIHANGGRTGFKDYYLGGGTTRLVRDPNWGSMATLNPAEDIFLNDPENALLLSQPPTGPNWTVKPGGSFDAFRTFEILNDSTDLERSTLAQRRFYRKLAPQTNEKMFEVHAPRTRDLRILGPLMDQMAEIGFDQLQAPEHPGGFNHADSSEANIKSMKVICDYAKPLGIRVGAYELMMASRGWGSREDNYNTIDPITGRPGSAFGQSACGASAWADLYYDNMWKTIEGAGMGAFKPDGPFHGDPCAATDHPHHKGLEDSQWAQWMWMNKVLHEGQRRNLYLTVPDWYFLNGQACTGMGYREATDLIDITLQTLIYRQYIFDATWHKTAQMGWVNLNTEVLHGGLEKNLEKYERTFFVMLSSGAQVWVRGHRLYDGPKSKAMLKKWMAWYHKHKEVILGDIIHLERPDGRGLDYYLHVNAGGKEKGMLLVFNPLDTEASQTVDLPLYYTGLTSQASIRNREGTAEIHQLDGASSTRLPVTLPAGGFTWFIIE
ncbi:LamG domain-containing protein [Planctomycetaceae bacterium SH139]